LESKCASEQCRCTGIKSRSTLETEKVCKHKPQMYKETEAVEPYIG